MIKRRKLPSKEELVLLLDYCPEDGQLRWKDRSVDMFSGDRKVNACNSWNGANAGKIAGAPHKEGYIQISVLNGNYLAHRIIGQIVFGDMDDFDIDHINGDRADNRLCNLRKVSRKENLKNRKLSRCNTSGHIGVARAVNGKWRAYLSKDGKQIHLGIFETMEAAVEARQAASKDHGFHKNHGRAA